MSFVTLLKNTKFAVVWCTSRLLMTQPQLLPYKARTDTHSTHTAVPAGKAHLLILLLSSCLLYANFSGECKHHLPVCKPDQRPDMAPLDSSAADHGAATKATAKSDVQQPHQHLSQSQR